jgi:microcystin-dependent protein
MHINVDMIYPIGSIYMSVIITNPSILFGGTWERIKGKCIVGVDEGDNDFGLPSLTGGEKTHTLTVQELPSHNHNILKPRWTTQAGANAVFGSNGEGLGSQYDDRGNQGGDQAHNNLQPYYTAYIWRRTA